jgi:short-subunit dehydrogenase
LNNNDKEEDIKMKNIWIIGASEGIGKELALKLGKNNFVFLSARQKDKLDELSKIIGSNSQSIQLDVSDNDSVKNAYKQIKKKHNIDIVYICSWGL